MTYRLPLTGVPWVVPPGNKGPGHSWNVITGCLNDCEWCYARDMANRRLREAYLANDNVLLSGQAVGSYDSHSIERSDEAKADPFWPRWWPDRLDAPKHHRIPRGIFVANMGDLCGPWVPSGMIRAVLAVVRECPQHRFYFLTKFPERLPKFNPWPENAWVGVTATGDYGLYQAICQLDYVEAKTKYISVEPLLWWGPNKRETAGIIQGLDECIQWLITGPLNGKLAKQHPCPAEWLNEIAAACSAAGVALYEKPECARILERPLVQTWPDDRRLKEVLRDG